MATLDPQHFGICQVCLQHVDIPKGALDCADKITKKELQAGASLKPLLGWELKEELLFYIKNRTCFGEDFVQAVNFDANIFNLGEEKQVIQSDNLLAWKLFFNRFI
jgi:hypothetical protein